MTGDQKIKEQSMEALRLHFWYQGSKFSFFQGKTSKELSERYRALYHTIWGEYLNSLRSHS